MSRRFISCFSELPFRFFDCTSELIGAGGGPAAAGDPSKLLPNLIDVHTLDELSDPLQVSIAAADIDDVFQLVVLDLKLDL